jgi:hypothetical protein
MSILILNYSFLFRSMNHFESLSCGRLNQLLPQVTRWQEALYNIPTINFVVNIPMLHRLQIFQGENFLFIKKSPQGVRYDCRETVRKTKGFLEHLHSELTPQLRKPIFLKAQLNYTVCKTFENQIFGRFKWRQLDGIFVGFTMIREFEGATSVWLRCSPQRNAQN